MEIYKQIMLTSGVILMMLFAFFYGMVIVGRTIPQNITPSMYMSCSEGSYKYCSCNWNGQLPDKTMMQECEDFIARAQL